jgi:hypothetical protein
MHAKREWVEETAASRDEDVVVLDGYDGAILAVTEVQGAMVVVYDHEQLLEIAMEKEGWSYEEALDWVGFNIENMSGILVADRAPS